MRLGCETPASSPPFGRDLDWSPIIVASILIILGLILLNGIFSGAEIAVVSARRIRLAELAEEGNRRARAVQALRRDPDRFFATVQIGITVVGATAAAFGGSRLAGQAVPGLQHLGLSAGAAQDVAFILVVVGISFLSLVLGELVPKSLGLRYAEGYSLLIARPLRGLGRLLGPLVWFLTFSSNLVLHFFGDRTTFSEARLSAEELQLLVEDAARQGSVDVQTGEIASRAFELKDVPVGAVMVPRNRMVVLERGSGFDDLKRVVLESGHSRFPVQEGALENVVGYVVAKDLLALNWESGLFRIEDLLRPTYFIPETMKALDALRELQRRRLQLAVVVDERGTVAGLVTVEDLVEELVGEILSEHETPEELAHREADGHFVIAGTAPVRDVNRALELELPEGEGFSTMAGLAISLAGRIPTTGEKFDRGEGWELEVLEANPRRVRRVALRLRPKRGDAGEEEGAEAADPERGLPH